MKYCLKLTVSCLLTLNACAMEEAKELASVAREYLLPGEASTTVDLASNSSNRPLSGYISRDNLYIYEAPRWAGENDRLPSDGQAIRYFAEPYMDKHLPYVYMHDTMFPSRDFLAETKDILAANNNVYIPEPVDAQASLEPQFVMNDYWRAMALQNTIKNPTVKDSALKKILELQFTDFGYPLKRYHIAAAVYAGANPDVQSFNDSALSLAIVHNDTALCKMLLEHGADANAKSFGTPIIFNAKTKAIAELLVHFGARGDAIDGSGGSLLHQAMSEIYDPELIPLYKGRGVALNQLDKYGNTPLDVLALYLGKGYSTDSTQKKVDALFAGLDEGSVKQLITPRLFEILGKKVGYAQYMDTFLRSYLKPKQEKQEQP